MCCHSTQSRIAGLNSDEEETEGEDEDGDDRADEVKSDDEDDVDDCSNSRIKRNPNTPFKGYVHRNPYLFPVMKIPCGLLRSGPGNTAGTDLFGGGICVAKENALKLGNNICDTMEDIVFSGNSLDEMHNYYRWVRFVVVEDVRSKELYVCCNMADASDPFDK